MRKRYEDVLDLVLPHHAIDLVDAAEAWERGQA